MGLDVLAVDDSGDSRNIETGLLGDILQDHRFKMGLVTIQEIIMLVFKNGLHCAPKCILTLLESLHKPLGGVQFLFHESRCLFLLAVGGALRLSQKVGVFLVDPDLRDGEPRHRKPHLPINDVQHKIRNNLLGLIVIGIVYLPSGRRIQFDNPGDDGFHIVLG